MVRLSHRQGNACRKLAQPPVEIGFLEEHLARRAQLGDDASAIRDQHGFPALDIAQERTEASLQLANADCFHSPNVVT